MVPRASSGHVHIVVLFPLLCIIRQAAVVCCAHCIMAPSSSRRVVLFPLPFHGHLNPMLRLAAALHARGLAITLLHTNLHPVAKHPMELEYQLESLTADVPTELMASSDVAGVVMALNAGFAEPFKHKLAAMLAGGVRCVITDAVWFSAQAGARELGVPSLALFTNSAASFRTFMAYPMLIDKDYLPVQESQKDDLVLELPPFRVRDLERIETSSLAEFASMLGNVVAGVRQASSGLILNTFDAIEGNNINNIRDDLGGVPVFTIGPLNKLCPSVINKISREDHDGCLLEWLDTQAPGSVLYVSFGTVAAMDTRELAELAWGLADSKRPFLWVVRPSSLLQDESLVGLEEEIGGRGRIVPWAPQEEVLSHPAIGAFLTHCGWNSTLEAISHAVPMLCRPCFGDQFGTARYVCDVWRVGVEVEVDTTRQQLQRGKIRDAIEMLMDDDNEYGKGARERIKDLKEMAAKCAAEDGTSHGALLCLLDLVMSL